MLGRWHESVPELGRWLKSVVRGYFNDHAVPGNIASLRRFRLEVTRRWLRALRRRGQKHPMTYCIWRVVMVPMDLPPELLCS